LLKFLQISVILSRPAQPALLRPLPCMQAEPEPAAAAPVEPAAAPEPPKMPAPPPEPPKQEFDITNYSITITLAVVFLLAKALAALGIIESSGN